MATPHLATPGELATRSLPRARNRGRYWPHFYRLLPRLRIEPPRARSVPLLLHQLSIALMPRRRRRAHLAEGCQRCSVELHFRGRAGAILRWREKESAGLPAPPKERSLTSHRKEKVRAESPNRRNRSDRSLGRASDRCSNCGQYTRLPDLCPQCEEIIQRCEAAPTADDGTHQQRLWNLRSQWKRRLSPIIFRFPGGYRW